MNGSVSSSSKLIRSEVHPYPKIITSQWKFVPPPPTPKITTIKFQVSVMHKDLKTGIPVVIEVLILNLQ